MDELSFRRASIAIAVLLILGTATAVAIWEQHSDKRLTYRLLLENQRQLLYDINHEVLAAELRRFANQMRWERPVRHTEPESFNATDPVIPPALRILKLSGLTIYDDKIEYDCGTPFLDFGIVVFKEGTPGQGAKKLGEGIWFYSEGTKIPEP